MPYRSTLNAYIYDGSFDGMLCCIFTAIAEKELPADIFPETDPQFSLCPPRFIETDPEKARRVRGSIPKKISPEALYWVENGFLSCEKQKERLILDFLRKGYQAGPKITRMLWDSTVSKLQKAVQFVDNEAHLLKGFLRFSQRGTVLAATISPKNSVLPRLAPHFSERLPEEPFLIHDTTHQMALIHLPGKCGIVPADSIELPAIDETEARYQAIWRQFYETIAIEDRLNPKGRMTHCPKRYWVNMTELCGVTEASSSPALSLPEPPEADESAPCQNQKQAAHSTAQTDQIPQRAKGLLS